MSNQPQTQNRDLNAKAASWDGRPQTLTLCPSPSPAGLQYRSPENKAVIVREVEENVWPAIVADKVKTVVYKRFPLSEAAEAHQLMETSQHIGKIPLFP
ncbi:hypothetical protein ABKV19_001203 [Rosa sericea]